uniref:Fatty acyl-CoA reductase n=1 Tax=Glossina brevipalpis TaxID=37001 RepID=A0A1A9WVE4_9MUSC
MSVTKFYEEQEIFITGGSGFLGKCLLEKIMRSFPNFKKIYLLMRNKKDKNAAERLKILLDHPVFERARMEQPQCFHKIVAIEGDCTLLGLGIRSEDRRLIENVSIIFHSAGDIRFDSDFKDAILMNMGGTLELIKIAECLPNLKAYIHTSTTYINSNIEILEEKIYQPLADWRTTLKLAQYNDSKILNILFAKYSSNMPNTYSFTKHLAEHIVNDYRHKIPILLYRPSIVLPSIYEPEPGWTDNYNTVVGLLMGVSLGFMHFVHGNPLTELDLVGVDVTVQGLILAAYKVGTRVKPAILETPLEVMHCSRANNIPISLAAINKFLNQNAKINPTEKGSWKIYCSMTNIGIWHYFRVFTLQLTKSFFFDILIYLSGKKPMFVKLQRRVSVTNKILHLYTTSQWLFLNKNFLELEKIIPPEDRQKLPLFEYMKASREVVIAHAYRGMKKFILNEPEEATPRTLLRYKFLTVLHYFIVIGGIVFIGYLLLRYLNN